MPTIQRVVKAANSAGLPRQKGSPRDIIPVVAGVQAQALRLAAMGKGKDTHVYSADQLYGLGKQIRGLADMLQNLPRDWSDTSRQTLSSIQSINDFINSITMRLPKSDGARTGRDIENYVAAKLGYILKDLKMATNFDRRRPR